MSSSLRMELENMEGRTFIIGREGHIYIDSPTASKQHAEIKISKGRIYLRDLDSTNGIFLIKNNTLVKFESGYVNPLQPVVIGGRKFIVKNLLEIVNEFAASDEFETKVGYTENSRSYG